jgi:hypothetical protein
VFKILVRIDLADIFFVSHWLPFRVSSTNMDSRKSAKISYYPHHDNSYCMRLLFMSIMLIANLPSIIHFKRAIMSINDKLLLEEKYDSIRLTNAEY